MDEIWKNVGQSVVDVTTLGKIQEMPKDRTCLLTQ